MTIIFKINMFSNFKVFSLGFICFLVSCSPSVEIEPNDSKPTYFYKTYSNKASSLGLFVDELPNGDIIVAGAAVDATTDEPEGFQIRKLDAYGNTLWNKEIPTKTLFYCHGTAFSNGDYVFCSMVSSSEVIRVDSDGNIVFQTEFNPALRQNNIIGLPVEGENGTVLISLTDGLGTGSASSNFIYTLDKDGKVVKVVKMQDGQFGGKVLTYQILKELDGEYLVSGTLFEYPWTGWSAPPKTFFARVKSNFGAKIIVENSGNEVERIHRQALGTRDGHYVYTSSKTLGFLEDGIPQPQTSFEIVKINSNVESQWKTKVTMDVLTLETYSLTENEKGEYVVTGDCTVAGSNGRLPFVVKIGQNGEILFTKVFRLAESVTFSYGVQNSNGSYLFAGNTRGFGNSADKDDLVVMKTDQNGDR